jgi:putative hydrolase of the HAD superfamily
MTAVIDDIDVLLFDLGGVLVDFAGVPELMRLLPGMATADDVQARWVACPHSNAFGMGRLQPLEFATRFVRDWGIAMAPEAFLAEYRSWTRHLLPGARALLDQLRPHYRLAALSNCNEVHWDRLASDLGLPDLFEEAISSHHVGCRKPDPAIYLAALERLQVPARAVLFFDDSQANVDAAAAVGMHARLARGPADVRHWMEILQAGGVGGLERAQ